MHPPCCGDDLEITYIILQNKWRPTGKNQCLDIRKEAKHLKTHRSHALSILHTGSFCLLQALPRAVFQLLSWRHIWSPPSPACCPEETILKVRAGCPLLSSELPGWRNLSKKPLPALNTPLWWVFIVAIRCDILREQKGLFWYLNREDLKQLNRISPQSPQALACRNYWTNSKTIFGLEGTD